MNITQAQYHQEEEGPEESFEPLFGRVSAEENKVDCFVKPVNSVNKFQLSNNHEGLRE